MENKGTLLEVTRIEPVAHLLPGIGNVDYIYDHINNRLVVNLNGQQVFETFGESAENIISVAKGLQGEVLSDKFLYNICLSGFGIELSDLRERTKKREIVEKRQILAWWLKHNTKHSLSYIGKSVGGFDHATVLHACRTVDNLKATSFEFRSKIDSFLKGIQQVAL